MDEEEFFEEEEIEEAILNEKEKNNKNKKSKTKKVTKNKTKIKKEKTKKDKNKKNKQKEIVYRDKGHPFLTFFLVIIIMILLGAVGYLVYENYYKEKEETVKEETNINKEKPKEKEEMNAADALLLGTDLYNSSYEIYNGRSNFSLNSEESITCDDEKLCSLISNFDSVVNNIFTESGKKEFERNAKTIRKIDGKFYYIDSFELNPNSYIETNLEVTKIRDDQITFKAISDYCISNETISCQNKESETKRFVIVKENNKWFVDEFVNPIKE